MAHLYHVTCYWSRWWRLIRWLRRQRSMPRFVYEPGRDAVGADELTHTQTFRCQCCGDCIHVDTDWKDADGGFIGGAVSIEMEKTSESLDAPK
jgi:hypothetical protein